MAFGLGSLLAWSSAALAQTRGDRDGDGRLAFADAQCAVEMAVGRRAVDLILDMDVDGVVNSTDARLILQYRPPADSTIVARRDSNVIEPPDPTVIEPPDSTVVARRDPGPREEEEEQEEKDTGPKTHGRTETDETEGEGKPDPTGGGTEGTTDETVPTREELIRRLEPLTSPWERIRNEARADCRYADAAAAQQKVVAAVTDFLSETFPRGVPPELRPTADGFAAELAALRRAAEAERTADESLRRAREGRSGGRIEEALTILETASRAPDLPACWHARVTALHSELMAEVARLTRMTEEAAAAAGACEYERARTLGLEVRRQSPALSWVREELPRIEELARRQGEAEGLLREARELAGRGDYDGAAARAQRALSVAPTCDAAEAEIALREIAAGKAEAERRAEAQRRAEEERARRPVVDRSVLLLIDTSGSMGGSKIATAREAAKQTVEALGPTVAVALATYGGSCNRYGVAVDFTTDHASVLRAIEGLAASGGTPMAPAIVFAQRHIEQHGRGSRGQILLLNDGQNNCGSVQEAAATLQRSTKEIRLDAIGVGLDPGSQAERDLDDLVRAAGNGRRYSATNADEVVKAFRRASAISQLKTGDPFVDGTASVALAELFAAVVEFFRREDIRGAIGQLEAAIKRYPDAPSLRYNTMLAYDVDGQHLKAIREGQRYLALAPNAFDAGAVRARIARLEEEQRRNPHAVYEPFGCAHLYRWAQAEAKRAGGDAGRRALVYDVMTKAQRGACGEAERGYEEYTARHGGR